MLGLRDKIQADKTMLYRCRILGTQDTLFDNIGRHYLYNCDIQGSIDFIFGNARSLYQVLQDCPRLDLIYTSK